MTTLAITQTDSPQVTPKAVAQRGGHLAGLLKLAPEFDLELPSSPARAEVENYIAGKFEDEYHAELKHFMPSLLVMRCADNISAAAGVRLASQDELFLEQYLDTPIDSLIEEQTGKPAARQKIAEIGNLVSTRKGSSLLLFVALAKLLEVGGAEWAVMTSTPQVQSLLEKLGFDMLRFGEAREDQLKEPIDDWGSYYDSRPEVVAVNVQHAIEQLKKNRLSRHFLRVIARDMVALAPEFRRV